MGKERRKYYRIAYPKNYMPKLIIGEIESKEELRKKEYKVVDICERGIKFTTEVAVRGFKPSSKIEVQVTLSNGELLVVSGKVLRCRDNQVVIYPSRNIPSSTINKEQEFVGNLSQLGYA